MMLNPILERELKSKMRSWRAVISIMVYLFFIGLITYMGMMSFGYRGSFGTDPKMATNMFDFIVTFQLGIIMFIVPLIVGGSISGEKQRQTLDLMLCTDVSPMTIIYGKIFAGVSMVLLLVIMAMPFLSITFVLGGIDFWDVLKIILFYVASAFYISCIAIYSSTKFKKNVTAIIMTYVIMGVLYFVPFAILLSLMFNSSYKLMMDNGYLILSLLFGANPGFGILSLLTNDIMDLTSLNSNVLPFFREIPTWVVSLFFFALISFISLKLAKKNLTKLD